MNDKDRICPKFFSIKFIAFFLNQKKKKKKKKLCIHVSLNQKLYMQNENEL